MGRKGAGHRAYLTRMRNLRAHKRKTKPMARKTVRAIQRRDIARHPKLSRNFPSAHVVGFYKKGGQTRPITKSDAQLNRTKLVKLGKHFKGVIPLSEWKSEEQREREGERVRPRIFIAFTKSKQVPAKIKREVLAMYKAVHYKIPRYVFEDEVSILHYNDDTWQITHPW